MAKDSKLPPTQQAALDRLKTEGAVNWSSTSVTEARAFNALVEKGLVEKISVHSNHKYVIKAD